MFALTHEVFNSAGRRELNLIGKEYGIKRRFLESNKKYKKRILSFFEWWK